MNADQLGGIVRAMLAALSGVLVAKGVVDAGTASTIAGAVGTIVVAAWSYWSNRPGVVIAPKA